MKAKHHQRMKIGHRNGLENTHKGQAGRGAKKDEKDNNDNISARCLGIHVDAGTDSAVRIGKKLQLITRRIRPVKTYLPPTTLARGSGALSRKNMTCNCAYCGRAVI